MSKDEPSPLPCQRCSSSETRVVRRFGRRMGNERVCLECHRRWDPDDPQGVAEIEPTSALDHWSATQDARCRLRDFWDWLLEHREDFAPDACDVLDLRDVPIELAIDHYHEIDRVQLEKERRELVASVAATQASDLTKRAREVLRGLSPAQLDAMIRADLRLGIVNTNGVTGPVLVKRGLLIGCRLTDLGREVARLIAEESHG